MKFWVVAKNGLVGMEMCQCLERRKESFVASSHKEADVLSKEALEAFYQAHRPTHIINCSANVNVDKAENEEKKLAYDVNVTGTLHLAELAKRHKIRLIHISTDYVFDGESDREYLETDPVHPINAYGKTKCEGEMRMLLLYPEAVSVRTASLYGLPKEGLVSGIIHALKTQEIVKHISDQVSSPTNTYDLAEALYDVRNESGIFHFVNKGHTSRLGLVEEIKRILEERGVSLKCRKLVGVTRAESQRPAVRPRRVVLSTKKIEPLLSHPIRSWQEAVGGYIECYLK